MSVSHTIGLVYTGGSPAPVSASVVAVGSSELNYNTAVAAASTLTFTPVLIMDPDARIQSLCLKADGNCTFAMTNNAGTSTTIGVTANAPSMIYGGLIGLAVPTSSDTYTLKVWNAGASSITFESQMVLL